MSIRTVSPIVLALVALSCGAAVDAPPFRIMFPDNRAGSVEAVLQRLGPSSPARPLNEAGVALAVVASADRVLAYDVARGRRLWQAELAVSSTPIVTPTAVVLLSEDDVVALSLRDGRPLWRFAREESFLGAAATPDVAYLVFGTAVSAVASITERRAGALVAVDMRTGDELYRIETERQFGAPEVAGDLVILPWERQYVSVFAGASGAEMARLRSRDDVISFVRARPEGLFYGGRGLYRLTTRSAAGTKAGQVYRALPEPVALPGEPLWGRDAYVPPVEDAARDKIRIYWMPEPSPPNAIAIRDELVYYVYYRYVFGVAPADGTVKWATRLAADVVGAAATDGGLVAVDETGTLLFLDAAEGLVRHRSALGAPAVVAVAFDVGAARPPPNAESAPRTARERLLEIATDRDNRLVPARAFAAQVLGRDPDPLVTADLVQILGRRDVPQAVRDAAARGLEGRRHGTEPLLRALEPRYDYLRRTEPGPVAALATALAGMGERRAVAPLIEHLEDPHSSPDTLAAIAKALGDIGDRSALEPLLAFLVRYHADPALGYRPVALAEATRAVVKLGARPARARLEELAQDPNALAFVRDTIRQTLEAPDEPEAAVPAATPAPAPAPEPEPARAPEPAPPPEPVLPRSLRNEEVIATLEPHVAALRRCIVPSEEGTTPARLRLVFGIVGATGRVDHPSVGPLPADSPIKTCIEEAVTTIQFPRFVELRQRVTYGFDTAPPPPTKRAPTKRPPRPTKAPAR